MKVAHGFLRISVHFDSLTKQIIEEDLKSEVRNEIIKKNEVVVVKVEKEIPTKKEEEEVEKLSEGIIPLNLIVHKVNDASSSVSLFQCKFSNEDCNYISL